MKTEKYLIEIEMPDGDFASPIWVQDTLQSESDIEDKGRWKVSVKEQWKPSDEQLIELRCAISGCSFETLTLIKLEEDLKRLL